MPTYDRAKARLEHEVVLLRREVATLRCKQSLNRKTRRSQAVVQARLEQQIQELQNELNADRVERERGGADKCCELSERLEKMDEHVVKQEQYIAFLEEQINETRAKYQKRMLDVRQNAELVERELKRVRREMKTIAEQAGELDRLKKEAGFLGDKLERRNTIIAKYEAQQEEMMGVMAGLQKLFDKKKSSKAGQRRRVHFSEEVESEATASEQPPVPREKRKSSKRGRDSFDCLCSALKKQCSIQEPPTGDQ
ncbi:trichohyalin [Drosophila biarmipes]|uniref:trichohyalin n=1 Tax=Drosophila biarmipes TaxID=125945 RepID=UPI0007E5D6D2|nr:trichohyalin [Drosophila biarmipes]